MPRYCLEPACTPAIPPTAPPGPVDAIDYGLFRFQDKATGVPPCEVRITLLPDGRGYAERTTKRTAFARPWDRLCHWLKTLLHREHGDAWYLKPSDCAEVISQRLAHERLLCSGRAIQNRREARVLDSAQPRAEPALDPVRHTGHTAAAPDGVDRRQEGTLRATPVSLPVDNHLLSQVLRFLTPAERSRLDQSASCVSRSFGVDTATASLIRRAATVRDARALGEVANLLAALPRGHRASDCADVMAALVARIPVLPARHREQAVARLSEIALERFGDAGDPAVPVAYVQACAEHCPALSGMKALAQRLCSPSPRPGSAPVLLAVLRAVRAGPTGRDVAGVNAIVVPDVEACLQLARSLRAAKPEDISVVIRALLAQRSAAMRGEPWDALYAATMRAHQASGREGPMLAALAMCLPDTGKAGQDGADATQRRWNALAGSLDKLAPEPAWPLAQALTSKLHLFRHAPEAREEAATRLQVWHAKREAAEELEPKQTVELALRRYWAREPNATIEPAEWFALWDQIERHRLGNCASKAAALLDDVPENEGWQRAVTFCAAPDRAWPTQRAETLMALIDLANTACRRRSPGEPAGQQPMRGAVRGNEAASVNEKRKEMRQALSAAALRLLEDGGPAEPLLHAWLPKEQVLAALRKRLPPAALVAAMTTWLTDRPNRPGLEDRYIGWTCEELELLLPDLTRIAVQTCRDAAATPEAIDDCARALAAFTRRLSESVRHGRGHMAAVIRLANELQPLLGATLSARTAVPVAAFAALADRIARYAGTSDGKGPPDPAHNALAQMLVKDAWDLAHRLDPAGRQVMMEALLDVGKSGDADASRRRWHGTTLVLASHAITLDQPDPAVLLEALTDALYLSMWTPFGRPWRVNAEVSQRIWEKAMCLPDGELARLLEKLAFWVGMALGGELEAEDKRLARAQFLDRIDRMPVHILGSEARTLLKHRLDRA